MNHKLNISCQTAALAELRAFLQLNLNGFTLSEGEKHQITLAVEEVCANLIIHSHGCNPKDNIGLEIKASNNRMIVEITDEGAGFNLLDYQVPELRQVIEEKRKGGIGILLVKKIMDEIEFESKNGKNKCRLIKNFPA